MNKTIADLREHLFAALAGLSDKKHPMDIDRAVAIADVAQVVINSAKVEIDFMRVAGGKGSGFIPDVVPPALPGKGAPDATGSVTVLEERPGVRITQHRLKG